MYLQLLNSVHITTFTLGREVDYRQGIRMMTVIFVPGNAVVLQVCSTQTVEAALVVHVLQS